MTGFKANHKIGPMLKYEVLAGLPPYGPPAEAFSATGHGTHREGLVVRFIPSSATPWIGNFQNGLAELTRVVEHPNGREFIIVAAGQAYVVDPSTRRCTATFGGQIEMIYDVPNRNMVVFGNGLWFNAVSEQGLLWRSERISWDGIKDVRIDGSMLIGKAFYIGGGWVPFQLNLEDGTFEGGSYPRARC